jgi:glyoxylase-like metal-dependent hydrolase (beta-lactamase superfamily II)
LTQDHLLRSGVIPRCPVAREEKETMATPGKLSYQVFVSDPIPSSDPEKAPNGERQMFQPISSTLIVGDTDAVLVDPPMTIDQTERVGNWVQATGKRLAHIFITHGHGDHWFGTAPLLRRFPGASAFASPGTIEVMRYHASPEVRAQLWDKHFPGQIPDSPVLASSPPGNRFELEGDELRIVEVGHTDTNNTTVLHVPSIGLVVAGDAVYNGVHPYLAEAANGGFEAWLKALAIVAALQPRHVVAGHKNKARADDPTTIDETRRYLEDAEHLMGSSHTALEFYNAMMQIYPDRLNPTELWFTGAKALFQDRPAVSTPSSRTLRG